jgi:hypothetical protein
MELGELVQRLRQDYPKGLSGERDALVTLLVQRGYPHAEAVRLAQALEAQGYAHFLPGAKSRWFFSP